EISNTFTHPLFNDLHQIVSTETGYIAVSTGLDRIIEVDQDLDFVASYRTAEDLTPLDKCTDYRLQNTKPHEVHPNFILWHDGRPWVTRAKQHDVAPLDDLSAAIPLADVM